MGQSHRNSPVEWSRDVARRVMDRIAGPYLSQMRVAPGGYPIHDLRPREATTDGMSATWEFEQRELLLALAIELWCDDGDAQVTLRMPLELEPLDDTALLTCAVGQRGEHPA